MKMHLLLCVFVLSVAVAGLAHASTVAQIEAMTSGTTGITLDSNPVVTAILNTPGTTNGFTTSSWSFLVNDGTGSMDYYGNTDGYTTPTVGDIISVTNGKYSPYHQIPELAYNAGPPATAISLLSSGNAVPAPTVAAIPQINVATEPLNYAGYMLELDNVTIDNLPTDANGGLWGDSKTGTAANQSYTVKDSSNNSMTLYYWPTSYSTDAAMYGTAIPTGPVNITGFVSVYGTPGTAEFTPTMVTSVPEPGTLFLLGAGFVAAAAMFRRRKVSK
ncbi:MAG: PEP-CTERM sorting domain-containing protein [Thermoguttaceae bacterium]|jgi:hypothetical protein